MFRSVAAPESSDVQQLVELQTVAPRLQGPEGEPNGAARAGGFSLHAGLGIASHQREKLERLCRYVSRPPVASERLALTASGQVRYTLKTPYRDGTTHIVLEPLDLMARLESCARCGGKLKIIASIEEPQLIAKILSHLWRAAPQQNQNELARRARGPPVQSSLL